MRSQFLQQAEPVEFGHHDIAEDEIRRCGPRRLKGLGAVADRCDLVALAQKAAGVFAHVGVVIGDQHALERFATGRLRGRCPIPVQTAVFAPGSQPACMASSTKIRPGAEGGGLRGIARGLDAILRKVGGSQGNTDREGASLPHLAGDRNGAAVQADEFLNQGEPDARVPSDGACHGLRRRDESARKCAASSDSGMPRAGVRRP